MNIVVTYDVTTTTAAGRRRLRRVAKICEGYGQRVQYSVFEVVCSQTDFAKLIRKLEEAIDTGEDSLRLYPVSSDNFGTVVRLGREHAISNDEAWTI